MKRIIISTENTQACSAKVVLFETCNNGPLTHCESVSRTILERPWRTSHFRLYKNKNITEKDKHKNAL